MSLFAFYFFFCKSIVGNMVVISESKQLKLVSFEQIIKRCPFCLKDTQQTAYYAELPDLSVTVKTDTQPPEFIKVTPKIEHQYSWDVMAKCSECGLIYRISGIPRMRIPEIPQGAHLEQATVGLTCCDVCYRLDKRYVVGETFIRLSDSGNVYLCKEHADEAEAGHKKNKDYSALIDKLAGREAKKSSIDRIKERFGFFGKGGT